MPNSYLFCINSEGRVNSLSTFSSAWREIKYVGLDFKRIAAIPHFLWAVGSDRQVYVHVYGLDVPIRVKEESYENERWLPTQGFSSHLLPTDRYHFSSADGTVERTIERIRVPSMAWQWESDWQLELFLNGKPLEHDGWTYAIDFPAQYHDKKQWTSCVRRRKWVRYRRYTAMNSWCAIAPLHKDPTQEPFIDVSVGGTHIPRAEPGTIVVWAVTAHGRVMFRTGVSVVSPEGLRWTNIVISVSHEVSQISVGPSGLVWAVLWNGRVLVRAGVTRDNLSGESWLEVRPPGEGLKLQHVSVGYNVVWATTNDSKVWFRKGINGDHSGISEEAAVGSDWVEMIGNMTMVSVGPNDQVWGIGNEDRCLYFRQGITQTELTGKSWRLMQTSKQLSRASSNASLALGRQKDKRHKSLSYLNRNGNSYESSNPLDNWDETSRSAPTPTSILGKSSSDSSEASPQPPNQISISSVQISESNSVETNYETPLRSHKIVCPIRSVGSVVGTEALPEYDVWDDEANGRDSGLFTDDDESLALFWAECDEMWTWVTASACIVDQNMLPNWFVEAPSGAPDTDLSNPWRIQILKDLRDRKNAIKLDPNIQFESAIDMTSWVKRCDAKLCIPYNTNGGIVNQYFLEDCILEMEWITNPNGQFHSATATVLSSDGITVKTQFSLSEVSCVLCCSDPGSPRLAIILHGSASSLRNAKEDGKMDEIRVQFSTDTELEDWLSNFSIVCGQINNVDSRPSDCSFWTTTTLGDIFVTDPKQLEIVQKYKPTRSNDDNVNDADECEQIQYSLDLQWETICDGYLMCVLHNGFKDGNSVTICGSIDDTADRISFNFESPPAFKSKIKAPESVNIALHLNPRFDEKCIVRNSMRGGKWDDVEERENNGAVPLEPGLHFSLKITCESDYFHVFIHGKLFAKFKHRLDPAIIYCLTVRGKVKIFRINFKSKNLIISPQDMYWRQMGGHLRQIDSTSNGIVWGINFDNVLWVYTGGWGGGLLQGLETSNWGINTLTDYQNYYVYENQRWNPVSGYTSTGLPTDRHMWSDSTGKHKRTRDHAKLLSLHWQWVSDWTVDFNTPGGVDRDGWQYAVDFPSKYHAKKHLTDLVRRRRWYRRSQLTTTGPWFEIGNPKIIDISVFAYDAETIGAWAISNYGDALFRRGVTKYNSSGTCWEHIPCDQPLLSISCGPQYQLWCVGKNGSVYWRLGCTHQKLEGESWNMIEPPKSSTIKQISVGFNVVWAIDSKGQLVVRKEITPHFPEGTQWQLLSNSSKDIVLDKDLSTGFRQVSCGSKPGHVWVITNSGRLCKRSGISEDNPIGNGWVFGINGSWQYISVNHWC